MPFLAARILAPALITLVTGCATFTGGGPAFDRVRATALQQAKTDGGCGDVEVASEADLKEVEKDGEKGQLGTIVVAGCGQTWSYLTVCAQTKQGEDCKAISTTPPADPYEKNRDAAVAEAARAGCDAAATEPDLKNAREMRKEDKVAHAALVTVTGCGSSWRVNTICGELKNGDGCMAFVVTGDEGGGDGAPASDGDDALKLDIDTDLNLNPDDINVDKID